MTLSIKSNMKTLHIIAFLLVLFNSASCKRAEDPNLNIQGSPTYPTVDGEETNNSKGSAEPSGSDTSRDEQRHIPSQGAPGPVNNP